MSFIDWELAEHPECYKRLYCNQVIDEVTLTHVICNIDSPKGVKRDDFARVMTEIVKTLQMVPFVEIEVPIDLRGRFFYEF